MRKIGWILTVLVLISCGDNYIPKPSGYFRIGLPEKQYTTFEETNCQYRFDKNDNAVFKTKKKQECWADVIYPKLKATVQLTYIDLENKNLDDIVKEGQRMAYSHTVKADGMQEQFFADHNKNVYGLFYDIKGPVATSTQFYMTDSTSHFLRGVLYFYSSPNPDSLKDVNNFMKGEIIKMIETLEWKNG